MYRAIPIGFGLYAASEVVVFHMPLFAVVLCVAALMILVVVCVIQRKDLRVTRSKLNYWHNIREDDSLRLSETLDTLLRVKK